MQRSRRPSRIPLLTALAVISLVLVNAGGFLLAHAAMEDSLLTSIDPKAVERAADSLTFSRDHLRELFKSDVSGAIADTEALVSQGAEIDVERLSDIIAGNLGDADLTAASPTTLISKFSQLQNRIDIQTEISRRVSVASFESAIMDKQTKAVTEMMGELEKQRDKLTNSYKDILSKADKASSYVNNLPPL